MRKQTLLFLFFIAVSFLTLFGGTLQAQSVWATAYYAGWSQGYNNTGYLPAQKIDFSAITHIVHFSLVPRSDGTLDDASNSVTAFNANELVTRAHAAGKKVIISVGGWATDVSFRGATSSANRATFVANLVNLMKSRGYDGIDIDWETLASSDAAQYTAFITALRTALDAVTPRPLLTAATAWQPSILAQVGSKFDQINIMSYDLSGAWPGWVTWHNAPIYNGGFNFPSTGNPPPSCDQMVNDFIAAGIPASKIGIGIDFYGYIWSGGAGTPTGGATDPRQSWTTAPSVQANVPYYTIMKNYYQSQYYRWDSGTQAAYLSIDNAGSASDKFISYDDETAVQKKVAYARAKGIGGVIIWELGGGYRAELPVGQQDLLLQALKTALGGVVPTVDITPPTISLTSPLNGATLSGTVTANANASDNVGVVGVQFKVDGANLGVEDMSAPYTASLNTLQLLNGAHTISAVVRDAASNTATSSVSISILNTSLDTTPPTVSITSPASGSTLTDTVAISVNASDNVAVTGVQFAIDGTNTGTELATAPYSLSLNTTTMSNGSHTISAIARDAAGNTAQSSVTITSSNSTSSSTSDLLIYQDALQSPWINSSWSAIVTFGSTEQFYAGTSSIKTALTSAWGGLSLHYGNWNASAGINPSQYVSLDFAVYAPTSGTKLSVFAENDLGQSFPKVNTAALAANQWTVVSIPMSQLSPSSQVIHRISIQEISGSTKTFYVDNLRFVGSAPAPAPPPVAPSLALPANGATAVATNPTLSWNASIGATTYRVQVSTSSSFATTSVDQSGISATSLSVSALSNNTTYYWRVNATNNNGTSGWSSTSSFATVALASAPDTTKPVVAFTAPLNGATISGTVAITANSTDNVKVMGVQFKLDGANIGTELMALPYTYSLNTTPLSNGSHTLSAVARDSAGNQAASSVTVTVANSVSLPSADLMVYQDALQTPWINASWSATVTFGSLDQIASGTSSIKVAQNAWGALRLHSGAWGSPVDVKAGSYTGLSFVIHGGSSGVSIGVYFENDLNQSFSAVKYVWVAANQWKTMSFSMSQLNPNNQVIHRLVIQDMTGRVKTFYIDDLKFTTAPLLATQVSGTPTEVPSVTNAPVSFGLGQNYPNPFNPSTAIQYSLPMQAYVTMEIFNTLGQRVNMLVDQQQAAGEHQVRFNASSLPSGVYFYRLTARPSDGSMQQPFVSMKRMILTK